MSTRRVLGCSIVALLCLFATGCFSIEQDLFINPDGSGEFALHVSIPDFPEQTSPSSMGVGPKKSPEEEMEKFTKELTAKLPPGVKMKEMKAVKQNGAQGFYLVFQFKELKDMSAILANFGKESLNEGDFKAKSQWTVQLEKRGNRTFYSGNFLLDLPEQLNKEEKHKKLSSAEKDKKPESTDKSPEFEKLGEQMTLMFLGTIKMRFVLHAPSPISETNADIVLNGKTAVWDCSPITFMKHKKPVEMKATF